MPTTRAPALPNRRGWAAAIIIALGASLASAEAAYAQPTTPSSSAPAPRRTVDLLIRSAPADDTRALEGTIRELLSRLQLTVVNRQMSSPQPSSLLASVDVDLLAPAGAHVVVRSATGSVVLDRTIGRDASPAIQREQIASAVRGATEAEILVDEDRVAGRAPPVVDPPPATPPPQEPVAEATTIEAPRATEAPPSPSSSSSSSSGFALDLCTFAGAGLFADHANPIARVGGSVGVASRRWPLRPSFAVSALYAFPFEGEEGEGDALTARASLVSFRALPAIEIFRRSRFALDLGAGGGIDVLSVDPASRTLPASTFREATTTRVDPIITGAVTGRLAIASDVVLTLTAMADIDLTARRYVFDNRGTPNDVLVPWDVRPTLLLGLSFTALGEGYEAKRSNQGSSARRATAP